MVIVREAMWCASRVSRTRPAYLLCCHHVAIMRILQPNRVCVFLRLAAAQAVMRKAFARVAITAGAQSCIRAVKTVDRSTPGQPEPSDAAKYDTPNAA